MFHAVKPAQLTEGWTRYAVRSKNAGTLHRITLRLLTQAATGGEAGMPCPVWPGVQSTQHQVRSLSKGSPKLQKCCRGTFNTVNVPKTESGHPLFPIFHPKTVTKSTLFFSPTQKLPGDNAVTKLTSSKKTPKAKSCLLPLLNSKAPLKRKNKKEWGHAASDCNTRKPVIFRNRNRDHN